MKKLLFIVALLCLVSITSCTNDSIEEIKQEEAMQNELENLDIYSRETEPEDDGTVDDEDTDEE